MFKVFLQEIFGITNYTLKEHKTGKDNTTYEVTLKDNKSFIIQKLSTKKSQKNKDFIEIVIAFTEKNIAEINFGGNYFSQRFFSFQGNEFQVMKRIPGKSVGIDDINDEIIQKTSEYLGKFHTGILDFKNTGAYFKINNFKEIFYFRDIAKKYTSDCDNTDIKNVFHDMNTALGNKKENPLLLTGVIHGDPSFKNFLIDGDRNITGLIDYDMMSVEVLLWDLVDMIRSYLKIDSFDKKSFHLLIKSYNTFRKLSPEEETFLQDYCIMMICNTGFRYIISYFEDTNLLGGKEDCLNKSQRCLKEIDKLNSFFI